MSGVWTTEETYSINSKVLKSNEITVGDAKEYARSHGYKKFIVKGGDGNLLSISDFPYEGSVVVEPYNEAA